MDKQDKFILGIDVSTKCIGVTLAALTCDGVVKVLEVGNLKLKVPRAIKNSTASLFEKSDMLKQKLVDKYSKYYISNVIIEEPPIAGNNSESTAMLMRFNGMVSQCIYDNLGIIPEYISSAEARKYGCPSLMAVRKFNKKGEMNNADKLISSIKNNDVVLFGSYPFDCVKKYILWNNISERYPEIKWEYTATGELRDENFDAVDSLVCVLGYINRSKYCGTEPQIVDFQQGEYKSGKVISYTVDFCGEKHNKKIILSEELNI